MKNNTNKNLSFIKDLEERVKELNCLYTIEEYLNNRDLNIDEKIIGIIRAVPLGWQYPSECFVRIIVDDEVYQDDNFAESPYTIKSNLTIQEEIIGSIEVFYKSVKPSADEGPFLKEERRLLNTIADRLSQFLFHIKMREVLEEFNRRSEEAGEPQLTEWKIVLEMLQKTDQHLFSLVAKKMLNIIFFKGIEESKRLFYQLGAAPDSDDFVRSEQNRPSKKKVLEESYNLGYEIFEVAARYLDDKDILTYLQKWMYEDKCSFLVKALANPSISLAEVAEALRKYHQMNPLQEQNSPVTTGIKVSLIRRFLTDQLQYINIAKRFTEINDFYNLLQNTIFPSESHGKLGGKSAGLLLANSIISKKPEHSHLLSSVKIPKTWFITSDGIMNFIYYNDLEDVMEQKYKDIDQIRQEYPHIVQVFKNAQFPPELINGLSRALDDFQDTPIIVRSSSLLEDRMGAAFAGKYKSLFLANQGSKQQQLDELMDAVAEVYASTFGPDPIGYRYERGLLDYNEEMGILIQEVVGKKVGKYFFPAFAGVAFSNNEFRWSARIKRDDGLIRLVPGLGTRAVDRIGDDYPILIAPGQPDLRVNLTFEEIISYSPKNMDVINLETNHFETVPIRKLNKELGNNFPLINEIFSICDEGHIRKPVGLGIDTRKHEIVPTFDNLFMNTSFIAQIHTMLKDLKLTLHTPVDIEFACNGENLYLLQCRPQSFSEENISAVIPKDLAPEKILFTAKKYVSNGRIPDITHLVYIDPYHYSKHTELSDLKDVGRAVGKLNKILPKKKFILMGPGRWGSRDDIRLGVNVSYSDINNTSLLIEIARKKGNYIPDLSFGTHFFQDLVESSIRYLPLYPDDEGIIFNDQFLLDSPSIFLDLLPEYKNLENTVRVIDLRKATNGSILRVLMNADEDDAVGLITDPATKPAYLKNQSAVPKDSASVPWLWRLQMIESLAQNLKSENLAVKRIWAYENSLADTARPYSDIDIIIHFEGSAEQRELLKSWLDGWNKCMSESNFQKTGFKLEKIIDVKFVSDFDFEHDSQLAREINGSNAIREIKAGK